MPNKPSNHLPVRDRRGDTETRGRGDAETRRKEFSYMVVKFFSWGLPPASCLLSSETWSCIDSIL
ncbi:MAG: hypothetical protein F6K47_05870 [Symploca sp. SIO2E6]|nr:hypothetical protein [Symploca sp. SIO2E6]